MNVYSLELTRIPLSTLKVMLRLARTLLRDQPKLGNAAVEHAAAKLAALIEEIRQELIRRRQEQHAKLNAPVATFDYAVDGLWVALRRGLERQQAFTHAGLALLPEELAEAGGLPALQARAARAHYAWERLFAVEGTTFTKTKLLDQAESMATLLKMIAQDEQLQAALVEALDPRELRLLEVCQKHYEAMLAQRLSKAAAPNLNQLRARLRWGMVAYVNAVHVLVDMDDPASHQLVLDALRPILTLRSLLTRNVSEELLEQELEDFVDAGLGEQLDEGELDEGGGEGDEQTAA